MYRCGRSKSPLNSIRALLLMLALTIVVAAAGCRRAGGKTGGAIDDAPEVQVRLEADPDSLSVGQLRLDVHLVDETGAPLDGAVPVTVRGDMAHAGMQPVIATAIARGNGVYSADFEWTMAGDWIVTVEATLPDGRVKVASFPYSIASD